MIEDKNGSILIVDDVIENVEVLIRILNREGYDIIIAQDGKTALEKVAEQKPELILLDVMMPGGLDGFEVCQILKANEETADIPVIFVTALANTVYIIRGFEVGAVDFITKPYRAKEVLARVNTHLTIQRQKKEIQRLRDADRLYYQSLSQMKDEVMQMASHDLKNPVNNIITAVYLLRKHGRTDDETGQEYLSIVDTSAKQMQALVSDILDLARIETGRALKLRPTALDEFMRENLSMLQLTAQEKQIMLYYTPPGEDVYLNIDPERMKQAVQNLVVNAIKYTQPSGHVELRVIPDDHHVHIEIIDTGVGIPPDAIPHIFEKFYRVKNTDNRTIEGTGLGLSIVKSIIDQHGGQIHAESELGVGSTFHVYLPLHVGAGDDEPAYA